MKLYRYYSNRDYCLKSIKENSIYFNSVYNFNDPFDQTTSFKLPNGKNAFLIDPKDDYKVACFTTSWKNYLMWSHYANAHKGYCIEYNIKNIYNIVNKEVVTVEIDHEPIMFFKVLYSNSKPIFKSVPQNSLDKQYLEFYKRKYTMWKYEKEIRAVIHSKECRNICFPYPVISSVILGQSSSGKEYMEFKNFCAELYPEKPYFVQKVSYNSKINDFTKAPILSMF